MSTSDLTLAVIRGSYLGISIDLKTIHSVPGSDLIQFLKKTRNTTLLMRPNTPSLIQYSIKPAFVGFEAKYVDGKQIVCTTDVYAAIVLLNLSNVSNYFTQHTCNNPRNKSVQCD